MKLSEIYNLIDNGDFKTATIEIKKLNYKYRIGETEISDPEYDNLIEYLKLKNSTNELFNSGVIESVEVDSDRKEKLKYPMFSLDKETEIAAIHKWLKNKKLPLTTLLAITSKYDGISILKDEYEQLAWSRGDGIDGETVHTHYKKLNDNYEKIDLYTIGEMIIPKPIFASRTFYRDNGEPFKNARNMIAGLKNSDTVSEDLKYAKHIRYGFANEDFMLNKSEQINLICEKLSPIPYKILKASELDIDMLNELFLEWGKEYDIDGLVFDIDDKNIRKSLGRERNNNPAYARAFKNPEWFEAADTTILEIIKEVSKQGYLKPVAIILPVDLDGATISRVTLNNYKFVKDNNLGVGSKIKIIRSGGVIPKIVSIVEATGFEMPNFGSSKVFWNETGVELIVEGTEEQEIKKIISFFEILGAENVSEGIINQLYNSGYKTIKDILNISVSDFSKLQKFASRKAEIVYDSIHKSVTNVKLSKLMHATSIFKNLGSKKIDLLMHFEGKPTFEEILKIEGFSDISANAYLEGYDEFYNWLSDMTKITIEEKKEKNIMLKNDLENVSFCFTGIRRKDLEEVIESRSGKVLSGVSKNLTYLVMTETNSLSSKAIKAQELGVKLLSVEDLEEFLS